MREIIGCDALIYQDVDAMKLAVSRARLAPDAQALQGFDASCFDGVYVTGDITAESIARMRQERPVVEEGDADGSRLALPNSEG